MRVAIIHDYLREYGGAERVVESLHNLFPDAPVYVASYYPKGLGLHNARIEKWDIRTSWFDKLHLPNKLISPFRILAVSMFEGFDLSEYDVVISSSAIYFAKAVKTQPQTLHIAYIHTPPRYLYGYVTSYNYKKHWWTKIAGELANHFLRLVDFQVSQRPDILVANSENVRTRIQKFYRREAVVIHPPVNIDQFKNTKKTKGDYYLYLGRLARGKGIDVIVSACTKLNVPLKIAGTGPILSELKKKAGKSVEFIGAVSDEDRVRLYAGAKAFIVASEDEDFGITQIEAMAAGTPVIAVRAGGYLETIIEGKTGEFFESVKEGTSYHQAFNMQTVENLVEVLKTFNPNKYQEEDCRSQAVKFSEETFHRLILELIKNNYPKK
jgi:glycosyltransferase involved in cell wall biosynthesis